MKAIYRLAALLLAASPVLAAPAAFSVKVMGQGPPVILIPGLACSGEVWAATAAVLASNHECHVLTLAGFAGVPNLPGDFFPTRREAIAGYIREHHLGRPAIVGHSLGGVVAIDLASTYPESVGRLVLVDSVPFYTALLQPGISEQQAIVLARQMQAQTDGIADADYRASIRSGSYTRRLVRSDRDHERIVGWSLASDRHAVSAAMYEMMSHDYRKALARIETPVLVLGEWAQFRSVSSRAVTEALFRQQYANLPRWDLAINDEACHFMMLDEPKWTNDKIVEFLNRPGHF